MIFHAIGMNYRHDSDFEIDRPNGSGDDLLLIFKTEAKVFLESGEVTAPPYSAIFYRKGSKQHYRANNKEYVNHFLHLECSGEEAFLSSAEFPFNKVIPLSDIGEAEDILRMISREEMAGSPYKERYMDMLIKMLILKLSDCAHRYNCKQPDHCVHGSTLDGLRAELYSNAGSFSSVNELAKRVNLSPSHFQHLYRERFGVSCYDDLLSARIRSAEYYLKNTKLTIREIAELCGYENDVCFMRLFKRRIGITPSEYRKNDSS